MKIHRNKFAHKSRVNSPRRTGLKTSVAAVFSIAAITTTGVEARSWTCHATVNLEGVVGGVSYTIPDWGMSGGLLVDREQKCKNYLTSYWLDNGAIWAYFALTPQQQNQVCATGSARVRVEYGFDKRKKEWNFTRGIPIPSCDCPKVCPTNWILDDTQLCANPIDACDQVDSPSEIFLSEDHTHGLYIRNGYISEWQIPTLDKANCLFKK